MSDLAYMTATEALRRFRTRELSPVELLDAVVEQAERVEPTINAFVWTRFEEARAEAVAAEARYGGRGDAPRPLEGVPFAIKDEMPIEGRPYTMASLVYADTIATETSPLAQRILAAGVVMHASTTTPEFSCAGFTHSKINGVTRNPWNLHYGVGGSSGGSGAALAAGTATLAGGSDIGGSIRIPASFNGVVGFKAPYGRVPVERGFNLDHYCHNGALARTVADCALLHNAMAGQHPMDHASLPGRLDIPSALDGVAGLRIALSPGLGSFPLDPEVEANTRAAAALLARCGAIVEEVDLTIDQPTLRAAIGVHFNAMFTGWIGSIAAASPELVTDYAIAVAEMSRRSAGELSIVDGLELEGAIWESVQPTLARYDALLCATVGTRGLVAGDSYADHGLDVGGVHVADYFESLLTPVFNVLSRCPVLNVPTGFGNNGVPTGMQIVGRPYDDVIPFRIGAALEIAQPAYDTSARRPTFLTRP